MIHSKLFFKTLSRCFPVRKSHNSSVIQQNINLLVFSVEGISKSFDGLQIIQVQLHEFNIVNFAVFLDLVDSICSSLL